MSSNLHRRCLNHGCQGPIECPPGRCSLLAAASAPAERPAETVDERKHARDLLAAHVKLEVECFISRGTPEWKKADDARKKSARDVVEILAAGLEASRQPYAMPEPAQKGAAS